MCILPKADDDTDDDEDDEDGNLAAEAADMDDCFGGESKRA
jgi:hypothetical protein